MLLFFFLTHAYALFLSLKLAEQCAVIFVAIKWKFALFIFQMPVADVVNNSSLHVSLKKKKCFLCLIKYQN